MRDKPVRKTRREREEEEISALKASLHDDFYERTMILSRSSRDLGGTLTSGRSSRQLDTTSESNMPSRMQMMEKFL